MEPYDVVGFISKLFNMPIKYLQFPEIIFYFIIPLISLIFLFYNILNNKLRIFRNRGVNLILASIMSIFLSFVLAVFPPVWTISAAFLFSILIVQRFSFKRLLLAGVVSSIIMVVYPLIMDLFL